MDTKRVLIVDDDKEIRDFVARVVADAGFDPLTAGDAEAALRIMHGTPIDVFLLDINLGGTNGLSLCRMIRKEEQVAPIIFVTAGDTTASDAFAAGCDDLVCKPIDPSENLSV